MRWRLAGLLVLLPLLSGCWDNEPLNVRNFITTIALDRSRAGDLHVFLEFPSASGLRSIGSGNASSGGGKAFLAIDVKGKDFPAAVFRASSRMSRVPYFGQVQAVIFGPGLTPRDVRNTTDTFVRLPSMDDTPWVVLSATSPSERTLASASPQEELPSTYLDHYFTHASSQLLGAKIRLWRFDLENRLQGIDPFLPLLEKTPSGYDIGRITLFRDFQRVGELSEDETVGWSLLTSRTKGYAVPVETPWGKANVRSMQARSHAFLRMAGGQPQVDVVTDVEGVVGTAPERLASVGTATLDVLRQASARAILAREEAAIGRTKAMGVDPFGYGLLLRGRSPRTFDALGDWHKVWPKVPVHLRVNVEITSTGLAS